MVELMDVSSKAKVGKMEVLDISVDQEAVDLCKELGLHTQSVSHINKKYEEELKHLKLTDDEYTVWCAYCPTAYVTPGNATARDIPAQATANLGVLSSLGMGGISALAAQQQFNQVFSASPRYLSDYSFDLIPKEVLKVWKMFKDRYQHMSFTIRTTEKTPNFDPILVGSMESRQYLIARWGDESPMKMTFKDVCMKVYKEAKKTHNAWVVSAVEKLFPDVKVWTKPVEKYEISTAPYSPPTTGSVLKTLQDMIRR